MGEDLAAEYLKRRGYKILHRNFRTRFGEIDIVAKKGKTLVFVEVKYGKGGRFRIDRKKLERIEKTAFYYMKRFGNFDSVRLDAVEINDDGIFHIEGVEV